MASGGTRLGKEKTRNEELEGKKERRLLHNRKLLKNIGKEKKPSKAKWST